MTCNYSCRHNFKYHRRKKHNMSQSVRVQQENGNNLPPPPPYSNSNNIIQPEPVEIETKIVNESFLDRERVISRYQMMDWNYVDTKQDPVDPFRVIITFTRNKQKRLVCSML